MIRTLIAERTSLIRAGLVALLSGTSDIDVIAEFARAVTQTGGRKRVDAARPGQLGRAG